MNIKIVTTEPFPVGLAASNRIGTYAQGLSEQGCKVCVCVIKPTELPEKIFNKESSGKINLYNYTYTGEKTVLSNNKFQRKIDDFVGLWKMCISILKENKKNKTDAIIYYSASTSKACILYVITRLKKIIFLKEESEFPYIYEINKNTVQKIVFRKIHYNLFDGYLLMTKTLIDYFKKEQKIKKPYLQVPMTVEYERFQNRNSSNSITPYIAYCGTLNNEKDGVDILIDAYSQISHKHPLVHLYLIGDAVSPQVEAQYKNQVNKYKLNEKVHFTGRKSKNEIPSLLCNASLLVLPRPNSKQAEGGFPTKLGEYLSTGKPVITTTVGEIPEYLSDGVNAFLAEPGSVESLSRKINEVFNDTDISLSVAKKGKDVVNENFNYKKQTKDICFFINNLGVHKK